jgi:diamine N-acetyltransferase
LARQPGEAKSVRDAGFEGRRQEIRLIIALDMRCVETKDLVDRCVPEDYPGANILTDKTTLTAEIRLAPITDANRALVASLELAHDQMDFVASNSDSLEEADDDEDAQPRAIMLGDRVVGFLMYEAPADHDEALIYRFMIDRAYQGRGYGKAALYEVLVEISWLDHIRRVSICYDPENKGARHLYRAAGFVEEGLDEDGEMIADLVLPAWRDDP